MDVGSAAAWVAAAIAAVVAARAWWSERRAKASAERAELDRGRATAAAQRTAQANVELAEAVKQLTARGIEISQPAAPPAAQTSPWTVRHLSGSTYVLENMTSYTQRFVHITPVDLPRLDDGEVDEIEPYSEHEFMAVLAMGSSRDVEISWIDQNREQRKIKKALPSRS